MVKTLNIAIDEKTQEKSEMFMKKMNSSMHFKSEVTSDLMSFEWLNEIEFACPYVDNIMRNPKVALIKEEDVVKIEKAKKITVDSVKDLSRHTHFIEEVNEETNEVRPSKILITRNEETYNTYENRFIYTLLDNLLRFMMKKEQLLEDFETKDDKSLEYQASTLTNSEKINIEVRIGSKQLPQGKGESDLKKEIEEIRARVKKIKDYTTSWRRSIMIESLMNMHAPFVIPPIKKTNMILKNPNFQIAMKLWEFLKKYDDNDKDDTKDNLDTAGNEMLKGLLDDSFLMDYFVLDSISSTKKGQKEKLSKYAVVMINQQLQRVVALLLNCGVDISDEEILNLVASQIKNQKDKRVIGSDDVKKKFKSAIDEYLERTQNYL